MTTAELQQRILALHAQGLKIIDISALLALHPQIVIRVLELANAQAV
jgi:hypothetical protein